MSWGLKFAGIEHRWERRTNYMLLIGILITGLFYYFHWVFSIPYYDFSVSTAEIGLFFLIVIGIFHLFARLSHGGEQLLLKNSRPWRR
jgi:hypothetical protein